MRTFRALLGGAVAGACALAVLPGVALAAPTAPYTALTVDLGEHHAFPVLRSGAYDKSNATMNVLNQFHRFFDIEVNTMSAEDHVILSVVPPTGQDWVKGQTYPTSQVADADHAKLDLTSNGRVCATATGAITIRDVAYASESEGVSVFAASYEFHCDGDLAAITGEVRFNSALDYVATVPDPSVLDLGKLDLGDTPTIGTIVQSLGSVPVTFAAARLTGAAAGDFQIVADYCSNRTLQVGAGCWLSVKARPTQGGKKSAAIEIPDSSSDGRLIIPVRADVVDGAKGTYYPITPARLMDTRTGLGAPKAKIGPDRTVNLQVAGRGGVPSLGVGAAVLNVTVTGPTMGSFLTVYPTGDARPTASSINFAAGWLGSNNVTVKLGTDGRASVYNRNGSTDVVVDVVGYFAGTSLPPVGTQPGGQYQWYEPYRILDTRSDARGVLPAGYAINGWIDFKEYNPHVKALILNITAVNPERGGYLTAWPGSTAVPGVSTVNYAAGKVVPNLAYVTTEPCPAGGCGGATGAPRYKIFSSATTHVVVDLVGVIDDGTVADGLRFRPVSPTRIVDSRIGQGLVNAVSTNETDTVTVDSHSGLLEDSTEVLAMNVTAVSPEKSTFLTVWPADLGVARPNASNLNPAAFQTVSNGVLGVIGPKDAFHVYNLAGQTPLVADVVGTFYRYPRTASGTTLAPDVKRPQIAGVGSSDPVRG